MVRTKSLFRVWLLGVLSISTLKFGKATQHESPSVTSTTQHAPSQVTSSTPAPWHTYDYPNPQTHPEKCGRGILRKSLVCDPDELITKSQADELDHELWMSCSETACVCDANCGVYCPGYSMSIALLDHVTSSTGEYGNEVGLWAESLRSERWRFGSCDNSLVIVLSRDPLEIQTAIGSRMKTILNDTCNEGILHSAMSNFTTHNYTAGLLDIVTKYRTVLKGGDCPWKSSRKMEMRTIIAILVGALLVATIIIFVITCCCCRRGRGGAGWKYSRKREQSIY